ncbi:hypothetical protein HNR53_003452 [Bacillus benzoevorans]|uniref:Uncharacterized protein n=1 Tax=Bacillus benzoevorans TaxID=1456 RepID=A0A7X0LWK0_9BACI|nr:hypothetical protein [Bacillus benzoevorans]
MRYTAAKVYNIEETRGCPSFAFGAAPLIM